MREVRYLARDCKAYGKSVSFTKEMEVVQPSMSKSKTLKLRGNNGM